MANILIDMASYISGLGLANANEIYRDTIPDGPDHAVALYKYAGSSAIKVAGSVNSVQIVVRDKNATTARTLAESISKVFDSDDGRVDLTPTRWILIGEHTDPIKLKEDSKSRIYYCFNLTFNTTND